MKTTASSTSADDAQLARRLPPGLLRTVLAYEDELQRLRASRPDDAHARRCRTAALERLVQRAIENIRARLEATGHRSRVSMVRDHIQHSVEFQRLGPVGRRKLPTRAVVMRCLIKCKLYPEQTID